MDSIRDLSNRHALCLSTQSIRMWERTCVKCSFDHVCLYEEELRTSESIGQVQTQTRKAILKAAEDDLFEAIR
jgi:spore coat polysaccharide biosynthesis predicted glycosyltransferase SpsG